MNDLSFILTAAESASASAGDQITAIMLHKGNVHVTDPRLDGADYFRSIDFVSANEKLNRQKTNPSEAFKAFLNELQELTDGKIIASDGYEHELRAWINVSTDFPELSRENMKETSYGNGFDNDSDYTYLYWTREDGWFIAKDTNGTPA